MDVIARALKRRMEFLELLLHGQQQWSAGTFSKTASINGPSLRLCDRSFFYSYLRLLNKR
jgi:hypothetical protein